MQWHKGNYGRIEKLLHGEKKIKEFLTYMGLFSKELANYLKSNEFETDPSKLPFLQHSDADTLSRNILGMRNAIEFGHGNRRTSVRTVAIRTYPGANLYYIGNFFFPFGGYSRLIYEILGSGRACNRVDILAKTAKYPLSSQTLRTTYSNYEMHIRELKRLGFVELVGKTTALKPAAKRIFSPKVRKVWEELKQWEYRIDIW